MIAQLTERLKQHVAPWVWNVIGRDLDKTRPFPTHREPRVEFHTMLSRKDLVPYIVGMKSLLRFLTDVKFAIVVHLDGAWTTSQRARLEKHFPGVRCIDEQTALARCEAAEGRDSFAARQRSVYISWRRLIDTQLFRGCDRLINIDSDHFFGTGHHSEGKIAGTCADIGHRFTFQIAEQRDHHIGFLPDAAVFTFVIGYQVFKTAGSRFGQRRRVGPSGRRRRLPEHGIRRIRLTRRLLPASRQQN